MKDQKPKIFPQFLPRLFRPPVYQGKRSSKNYFEGWYCKLVNPEGDQVWSVIFGISFSSDPHSFLQLIEGLSGRTEYYRYPVEAFSGSRKTFSINIGPNKLDQAGLTLDLKGDTFRVNGYVQFDGLTHYPVSLKSPGIMGWYRYVPFMECYHGVVSMNHVLSGNLEINGKKLDFTGGKGYMEKDWGKSMPSDWIWVQCNHFQGNNNTSLMISIARIPWLRGHFPGFLSFFYVNGKVYRFATYNRSQIKSVEMDQDEANVVLVKGGMQLEVNISRSVSGNLKAPEMGEMSRKIAESLDAELNIRLRSKNGQVLLEDTGHHAGLEIVGDVTKYL